MSNTDLILKNVANLIHLTVEEEQVFALLLASKTFKTKQYLLSEGNVCRHSIFVAKGCLKGFTVDKNGLEHILSFAPPNWWIADLYSLFSQQPGILNIQATEATEVLLLSKTNQEKLYHDIPRFERFFRIITENSLVSYQQRVLDNLSLTAEERYKHFCQKYPGLIHCLPQKEIASYIGVTPEFFSKMRKRMLKNK